MCNLACLVFIRDNLLREEVEGKIVVESGSRNVNGSGRDHMEPMHPARYVGTDIVEGFCVDMLCNAVDLVKTFGGEYCDVLLSTEMVEHVEDWRGVISNFKRLLKPGGVLYLTTRSEGFGYHGYPADFWRYSVADMQAIFEDFEILKVEADPSEPGVFIKARKPVDFVEKDLGDYELFSIVTEKRAPHRNESPIGENAAPGNTLTGINETTT